MRILPSFEVRSCAMLLALVACVGSGQTSFQSLPNGYLNADANTGTMFPFSTPATQKWHWVYDSGQFVVQNPISITQLAIRAGVATATWPGGSYNIEISMGSSLNNYATSTGYSTTFASNFASGPVVVFNGTWTVPAGGNAANPNPTAAWENLVLQTPFNYDASLGQDLIVQLRTIGPNTSFGISLDCKSTPTGGNGGAAMGNLTSATAMTATFVYNELVPVIRIGYTTLQALWQVNQANASIDVDGLAPQPPVNPIMRCVNAVSFLHLSSPLGTPWDLALGFAPPVPLGGGALALIDGQVVNMNLADPTLLLLNGLFAGGPFPAGTLTIPFSIPVPLSITMQFAVADPSTPSNARLSQALRVQTVLPSGPISYTMNDDSFVFVDFSGAPFCGPPSFTFFGVAYTGLYLASNGFVCFGAGNQTYAPTSSASFLSGQPRVAPLWTDLNPPAGGTITVGVTATTVVCDWAMVPQFGQLPSVNRTFRLTLDSATGNIIFDNYAIAGGNASTGCGVGITPGGPNATDPGSVIWINELGVGVLPGPSNSTDITYEISTNSIVNLGAISSITFMPNLFGNYDRLTL